jgi:hypothetical protein
VTSGRIENGEKKMHVFKSIQWQEKKPNVVVQVSVAEGKHNGPTLCVDNIHFGEKRGNFA